MYEACPGRLDGKVALVTGSTHGIGLGVVRRFAREGATVVVNDHGEHDGSAVAANLPGEATYVEADVRDPEAAARLVDETVAAHGRVDILVNNVGDGRNDRLTDVAEDDWDWTMDTCLKSAWRLSVRAVEDMPAGGSIVNVSSRNASAAAPEFGPYSVAKAGLNGLTRQLAVDLGVEGIRANGVEPGAIEVDDPEASDEMLRRDEPIDPVGRVGHPADVAALVAFLAADESRFVTGATIPVDGGRGAVLVDEQYTDYAQSRREEPPADENGE